MNIKSKAEPATCSVAEVLLMLRAPGAGWLATLAAAIDEAGRDPDFNPAHRAVLARYLNEPAIPVAVVDAARQRVIEFEQTLAGEMRATQNVGNRVVA